MPRKRPWNKGRTVGQSRPLNPDQVDLIRLMFDQRANPKSTRDLALFNLALDSQLRGCDLVALKVRDVSSPEHGVHEVVTLRQQKVSEGVTFHLSERTRLSLERWIIASDKVGASWLFTGLTRGKDRAISVEQFRRLVKEWVSSAGLDPTHYTPHSLRRTQATYIYRETGNLRAAQLLLGHKNIQNTVRYLGIDKADALEIARKYHL